MSNEFEFIGALNARPLKLSRAQLSKLPKTTELATAVELLDSLSAAIEDFLPKVSVLLRPSLLNESFENGITFQIIHRSGQSRKNGTANILQQLIFCI